VPNVVAARNELDRAITHLVKARAHLGLSREKVPENAQHSQRQSEIDLFIMEIVDVIWRVDHERARIALHSDPPDEQKYTPEPPGDTHVGLVSVACELNKASLRLADARMALSSDDDTVAIEVAANLEPDYEDVVRLIALLTDEAIDIRWRVDRHRVLFEA